MLGKSDLFWKNLVLEQRFQSVPDGLGGRSCNEAFDEGLKLQTEAMSFRRPRGPREKSYSCRS